MISDMGYGGRREGEGSKVKMKIRDLRLQARGWEGRLTGEGWAIV